MNYGKKLYPLGASSMAFNLPKKLQICLLRLSWAAGFSNEERAEVFSPGLQGILFWGRRKARA